MVSKDKLEQSYALLPAATIVACCVLLAVILLSCSGRSSQSVDDRGSVASEQVDSTQPDNVEEGAKGDDGSTSDSAPVAQIDIERQESSAVNERGEDEWDDEEEWDEDEWDVDSGEPYPGFSPDCVAEKFINKYNEEHKKHPIEKGDVSWKETGAGYQTDVDLGNGVTLEFSESDGAPTYSIYTVVAASQKMNDLVFKKAEKVLPYLLSTKASVLRKTLRKLKKNPEAILSFKNRSREMYMSFDGPFRDEYTYRIRIYEKTW